MVIPPGSPASSGSTAPYCAAPPYPRQRADPLPCLCLLQRLSSLSLHLYEEVHLPHISQCHPLPYHSREGSRIMYHLNQILLLLSYLPTLPSNFLGDRCSTSLVPIVHETVKFIQICFTCNYLQIRVALQILKVPPV